MNVYDVAVIGAGPAGMAAAVSAARAGARVLLVEQASQPGGAWAAVPCASVCGLYGTDGRGKLQTANGGFPAEFAARLEAADAAVRPRRMGRVHVLPCRATDAIAVFRDALRPLPLLVARWQSRLVGIEKQDSRITRIAVRGADGDSMQAVRAVVDGSGTSAVGRLAGERILPANAHSLAPAVAMRFAGVDEAGFDSPSTIVRILLQVHHAVREKKLPPGFDMLTLHPARDAGEVVCLLNAGFADTGSPMPADAGAEVRRLADYLRLHVPAFAKAVLVSGPHPPHPRASDRTVGRYVLTGEDVLRGRRFDDEVARCAWPIEQWEANGRTRLRYLDRGAYYGIPARALRAQATENLFLAGRCISADDDAIGSARVAGCCLATGEAAGRLAQRFAAHGGHPS